MVGMGQTKKLGAMALAMMTAASSAMAASCATPDEVTAIQAAVIQQQLMVAALTCNQIEHFNAFQTSYAKELRRSDASLAHMFHRLYAGPRGEAEYHGFKTRLANNSSIRSIHDNEAYCQNAGMVFDAALIIDKPSLASFVSGIEVTEQGPVDSCSLKVAVGFASAIPPVAPKPNPLRIAELTAPPAPPAPATPGAIPAPAPANN
jgi:hypothetical protein